MLLDGWWGGGAVSEGASEERGDGFGDWEEC